jgi:hypothetical protein
MDPAVVIDMSFIMPGSLYIPQASSAPRVCISSGAFSALRKLLISTRL